jgi:hypothetical protein
MRKSTKFLVGGGGLVVAVVLSGCAGEISRPPADQLQQGLNLLDVKDPTWGVAAAYRQDNKVIYIETRVGAPMPEIYRQDNPDGPQNEMDLRFVDQNNHTFFVQRGGDNYVDPTWADDVAASRHAKIDPASRDLDFRMAKLASAAFAKVVAPELKFHAYHFTNFAAQPVPSENADLRARVANIPTPETPGAVAPGNPTPKELGYAWYSNGDYDWLETDRYSGSTGCFAWICTAKHSATIMWDYKWNNGSPFWIMAVSANNHGRSYSDSGMGYGCYSNGGWFYNPNTSGSTAGGATGNWDGAGGCQTSYNWNSGGWDHLCNDDAAYELWQAKSGSWQTSQGDQTGFVWTSNAHFACACQNNSGCDGDWSAPNCP